MLKGIKQCVKYCSNPITEMQRQSEGILKEGFVCGAALRQETF